MEEPRSRMWALVAMLILGAYGIGWAGPVGTAFTYQGQLKEAGVPANGTFDFKFALYDDPKFGSQVGVFVEILNQEVTDGLFTVLLDFGNVFDGTGRWLWVLVRQSGPGSYAPLWPRQPLTPAPYALNALNSPSGGNTLDDAYDQGGPGQGRTITADAGSVVITDNGLTVNGPVSGTGFSGWDTDASDDLTCADCDVRFVNEGQQDSIGSVMIVDNAVTQQKIEASGASAGRVLKTDGVVMRWDTDLTGGSSQWASDANGIWYAGNVGINENSAVDFDLHVGGDLRVTQRAMLIGDVTLGCASCNPLRIQDNVEIGGNLTFDFLSSGTGTTVIVDSNGRLRKLSSSLRYKSDVADLSSSGNTVLALRPVSFEWNSTGEPDIGLIADEVAEVIPDLVLYDAEGRPDGVKYDRLSVYLLQVVKSQRAQIAAQEQRLDRMEAVLTELGKAEKGARR